MQSATRGEIGPAYCFSVNSSCSNETSVIHILAFDHTPAPRGAIAAGDADVMTRQQGSAERCVCRRPRPQAAVAFQEW